MTALAAARAAVAQASTAPTMTMAVAALLPLFADVGWLARFAASSIAPMHDDPLSLPPFNATRGGATSHLVIAASPCVSLAVTHMGGVAERQGLAAGTPRICFTGHQTLLRLLSSTPLEARLARRDAQNDQVHFRSLRLPPHRPLVLDERRRALWLGGDERPVWLLRARIRRNPAPLMHSYRLADGAPCGVTQGDDAFARSAMLAGVLRAMGDRRAVPALEALLAIARGAERWTVMRELLALDADAAWPALEAMAASEPNPAVRAAAAATLLRHGPAREAA